jgi:hypothetical protein
MKVIVAVLWRTGTEYRTANSVKEARKYIAMLRREHKVEAYIEGEVKDPEVIKRNDDFFKKFL